MEVTSTSNNLIIFGAGSFAKLMRYYFDLDSCYNVVGFTVDKEYLYNDYLDGLPIIDFDKFIQKFVPEECKVFIAVGYKNFRNRADIFNRFKTIGYSIVNFISSQALMLNSSVIGENNVFLPGVIIEPFVTIRDNNIFWSRATICHNTIIGSHNFFAAGSVVGGFSKVNDMSFIGFNATIINNITVANETLVGAASLVLHDTEECSQYVGVPATKRNCHHKSGIVFR